MFSAQSFSVCTRSRHLGQSLSLEELRTRFETQYLPAMRFVTVSMPDLLDPQVLAITDTDDRPTGQLALLTAPAVVFSEDKHLRRPGFASSNWRETAKGTAMVAEAFGELRVMVIAATLPVAGACWGSNVVGRQLGIPRWVPGAAFAALTGLGAYMFMRGPDPRAAAENGGRNAAHHKRGCSGGLVSLSGGRRVGAGVRVEVFR